MKIRKSISVILILAMTLAVLCLVGCSAEPEAPSAEPAPAAPAAADNSGGAQAEAPKAAWPEGTVTINCAFGAGGDTDTTARIVAEKLTEYFGETFVVVNVTGAGGATAAIEVMGKEPDGYNLLFNENSVNFAVAAGTVDFTYIDDLKHVGTIGNGVSSVMCCTADNKYGWKTMDDVLNYIKEHPGEVTISDVAGTSTSMLPIVMGINGYETRRIDVGTGGAERVAALLGGQVDLVLTSFMTFRDYIESGEVIPLVNNGDSQLEYNGELIPHLKEFGLEDASNMKYYRMFFPKDTPDEIVETLAAGLKAISEDPEFIETMEGMLSTSVFIDAAGSIEYDKEQIARYEEYSQYLFN